MQDLIIRPAQPGDLAFIKTAHLETRAAHRRNSPGFPEAGLKIESWLSKSGWHLSVIRASCQPQKFTTFVAVKDGAAIGYIVLMQRKSLFKPRFVNINDIYVAQAYRKKGVATQLIRKSLGLNRMRSGTFLAAQVHHWNHPSLALFEKEGFLKLEDDANDLGIFGLMRQI